MKLRKTLDSIADMIEERAPELALCREDALKIAGNLLSAGVGILLAKMKCVAITPFEAGDWDVSVPDDVKIERLLLGCVDSFSTLELEATDVEAVRKHMDTMYFYLKLATRIGFSCKEEKELYRLLRETFIWLQDKYGMVYDNDEL